MVGEYASPKGRSTYVTTTFPKTSCGTHRSGVGKPRFDHGHRPGSRPQVRLRDMIVERLELYDDLMALTKSEDFDAAIDHFATV